MNQRILSLCLALALLLCLLPAAPTAAAAGDVVINKTNFPDANFRRYVSENCDPDGNGVLSPTEISNVTNISCPDGGIASLKGIEYFTALEWLYCYNNQLKSLDVSKNTALIELDCYDNQLTSLDVGKNTALVFLGCYNNQLTSLDLSKNTALTELYCYGNQLKSLDVSKNTALESLFCYDNQLKSLDVSKNTALEYLSCYANQLTALDVSRQSGLLSLNCGENQLTQLDLSKNYMLGILNNFGNPVTALDLTHNTALYILNCGFNKLTSLDLSKNTQLQQLWCEGNALDVLDVSAAPALVDALEHGEASTGSLDGSPYVMYETSRGNIIMDLDQKTIPNPGTVPEPTPEPVTNPFVDVAAKDYYYDAVLWAYGTGVTAGTNKTHFSPNDTCTREQVVTFLWRAKGSPEPKGAKNPFQDVRQKDYFYKAVLWAVENGITQGESKTRFGVGNPCTREQVVTFLWRTEGEANPKTTANPFQDVKTSAYSYRAVLWAVEQGITQGTSKTKFSPADTCTRGQIVTFLYRDVVGVK